MVTLPDEAFFLKVNNHIASRYRLNLREALEAVSIGYCMDPVERAAISFVLDRRARLARGETLPVDMVHDLESLRAERMHVEALYDLLGQQILELSRRVTDAEFQGCQTVVIG